MIHPLVEAFNSKRSELNTRVLATDNLVIKRFFNLDSQTYQEGALSEKTKELMGLSCSMVLRCDDCINYHLTQCHALGCTKAEIQETFSVALVIGGSIVIPHLRRAVEFWEALEYSKA